VPERQPPEQPLRPGAVGPNVHLAIRIAGVAAGLGEIGWSKVFLTRRFGPRVRLHAILTEAELRPDPLIEPGSLCTRCMACVEGCQADAIPHVRDGRTVRIQIEGKTYEWADVQMGRCTLGFHGGDPSVSPFLHKTFPGYCFDPRRQDVSENAAYKLCWPLSLERWPATDEDPSGWRVEGHARLRQWGGDGSFAVGGSRGCMRSCFDCLERTGRVEQTFENGRFVKRPRWLLSHDVPARDPADAGESEGWEAR
jgi:ferredoxin